MIDAPYAADLIAQEDAQLQADRQHERSEEIFYDCLDGGWKSYSYIREWMIESVHAEIIMDELKLVQALYWLGSSNEVKATNAKLWLINFAKPLESRLNELVDEQLKRDAADQEAWELRHVD
jgi:hypothetical protein